MSLRIDVVDWISGAIVIGNTGLGVLAETIPSTGGNGASFLYNDLSLPADNGKEIRALILTYPSAGTLFVYEDGSFEFTGAPDGTYTFTYQLYVDGVETGSPATTTLIVGAPAGEALAANAVSGVITSATIITSVRMLANASSVASTSANLSTSISMSAGSLSITTTAADLSTAIQLSAQAVISASSNADLTVASAANYIEANGVVSSVASANLTTSILLNAVAQAVCNGYANLTVGTETAQPAVIKVKFKNPNYKISFK